MSIKSSKFLDTPRTILDEWLPYYAGFSGDFADSVIKHAMRISPHRTPRVYDPWAGVGTSLYAASLNGLDSFGIDVNPFSIDIAVSKSPNLINYAEDIDKLINSAAEAGFPRSSSYGLHEYFDDNSIDSITLLLGAIEQYKWPDQGLVNGKIYSALRSLVKTSLILECRKFAKVAKSSNPTWEKSLSLGTISGDLMSHTIDRSKKRLKDIQLAYGESNHSLGNFYAYAADNRHTCLAEKFDVLITSPPYLTRIDYVITSKFGLSFYEKWHELRLLRETTTGSPIVRNDAIRSDLWGEYARDLDDKIYHHPSKASSTYYIKIYRQYVQDIYQSMTQIASSSNHNAIGYIIVQSSYYKEIKMDLSKIFIEAAKINGFSAKLMAQNPVRSSIANINSSSRVYKVDKSYSEDVVFISN